MSNGQIKGLPKGFCLQSKPKPMHQLKKKKSNKTIWSTICPFCGGKVIFPYMGVCTLQGEVAVKPVSGEKTLAIKFQSQGHAGCQCLMLRE